jgi:hypothetical protein
MHYTIENNPRIDAKIKKDQEDINFRVLGLLGNDVHSIILCGGFGRGEGTVIIQSDKIHVVNDYDITIVLKEHNPIKYAWLYQKYYVQLQALACQLAKELRMKQIDLSLKSISYFKKQNTLKIGNYEVKHGHVLTYGEYDPTILMPNWQAENFSFFEGTWLFRNRGAGMLIPALYFMRDDGIPEEKRENFVVECGKAQLAMGDCILLLKKKYHHLYSQRLRFIDDLDVSDIPAGGTILAHYREALEQKLRPESENFYNRDLVKWWFEIVGLLDLFFRFFESRRLGLDFFDWQAYADHARQESRIDLRTLFINLLRNKRALVSSSLRQRILLKSRKANFISLVPLLLFSIHKNGFFLPYMERAARMLAVQLKGKAREDWLYLVRTFLHELHPQGEVADVIRL